MDDAYEAALRQRDAARLSGDAAEMERLERPVAGAENRSRKTTCSLRRRRDRERCEPR